MSRSLDEVAMQVSGELMVAANHLRQLIGNNGQIIVKRDMVLRYVRIFENSAKMMDRLGIASEDETRQIR